MPTRMKPEERKALLLKQARKLIHGHDYEQVRVEDIMKIAEISKGGFYHHFKSKDEILSALVDQEISELVSTIENLTDSDPTLALVSVFTLGSRFLDSPEGIGTTLNSSAAKALYLDAVETSLDTHLKPALEAVIVRGSATGAFSNVDAVNTAELIMAVSNHANRKSILHNWPDARTISFTKAGIALLGKHLGISEMLASALEQLDAKIKKATS